MNNASFALVGVIVVVALLLAALLFQLVNKLFKVHGITYLRALSIFLTYSIVQGIFRWLGTFAQSFSGLFDLIGFILAITASYYLYKKYSSASIGKFILVWVGYVAAGILIGLVLIPVIVILRLYIAQPFMVSGNSMVPTYPSDTYLIIEEWDKTPHKGDVVVAKSPKSTAYMIARVAGVPGDIVSGVQVPAGNIYLSHDNPTYTPILGLVPENTVIGKPILNLGVVLGL